MSEKTKELIQQLQDGVRTLFASDKYADYLRFLASFHSYSAGNCLLIWSQLPSASLVASYSDWNQKHHRQVKRGSKAIRILAPHTYKEVDADGVEHQKLGFHVASCFDVSQTYSIDDTPLPEIAHTLDSDVMGYDDLLHVLLDVSPVPVEIKDLEQPDDVHGYFSPSELRIAVRRGMSEAQTIKTLLHEQAHAWTFATVSEEKYNRHEHEVIAESVAYIVSSWLGIDTSTYSFGYVAGWSSDKTAPELRSCLECIRKIADLIIDKIEEAMTNGELSKENIA